MVVACPEKVHKKFKDQRAVLVMVADPTSGEQSFSFYRSKWLQRAPVVGQTFAVGDRVQLNSMADSIDGVELAGKCLGAVAQGRYGIVTAVGPVRNGVQRNVEVMAQLDSSDASRGRGRAAGLLHSLYPSSALVMANKAVANITDTMTDLIALIREEFQSHAHFRQLDVAMLVTKMGFKVSKRFVEYGSGFSGVDKLSCVYVFTGLVESSSAPRSYCHCAAGEEMGGHVCVQDVAGYAHGREAEERFRVSCLVAEQGRSGGRRRRCRGSPCGACDRHRAGPADVEVQVLPVRRQCSERIALRGVLDQGGYRCVQVMSG